MGVNAAVRRLIDVGRALMPGLAAVIHDHIAEYIPMILEGDFILPELCASVTHPKVKSVFLYEPSKEQILQNYLEREGTPQHFRADVSHAYGNWLAESCSSFGIPVVTSRPWDDLMERVIDSLNNY
jgi:2-phosphoglycerate kinase